MVNDPLHVEAVLPRTYTALPLPRWDPKASTKGGDEICAPSMPQGSSANKEVENTPIR